MSKSTLISPQHDSCNEWYISDCAEDHIYRTYVKHHYWDWVSHICVTKLNHHWYRKWRVACLAPNHYVNQYWLIVSVTFMNLFSEIWMNTEQFSLRKISLEMSSMKRKPFCLGLNIRNDWISHGAEYANVWFNGLFDFWLSSVDGWLYCKNESWYKHIHTLLHSSIGAQCIHISHSSLCKVSHSRHC